MPQHHVGIGLAGLITGGVGTGWEMPDLATSGNLQGSRFRSCPGESLNANGAAPVVSLSLQVKARRDARCRRSHRKQRNAAPGTALMHLHKLAEHSERKAPRGNIPAWLQECGLCDLF